MANETEVNILLKCRSQIENKIANLQDALALKRKAHASLSDTIDLLRGWHPEVVPPNGRMSYQVGAIKDAIADFFVEHTGPAEIEEICKPLQELGLIPSYTPATRGRISQIMKGMPELTSQGNRRASKWMVKARNA